MLHKNSICMYVWMYVCMYNRYDLQPHESVTLSSWSLTIFKIIKNKKSNHKDQQLKNCSKNNSLTDVLSKYAQWEAHIYIYMYVSMHFTYIHTYIYTYTCMFFQMFQLTFQFKCLKHLKISINKFNCTPIYSYILVFICENKCLTSKTTWYVREYPRAPQKHFFYRHLKIAKTLRKPKWSPRYQLLLLL